MQDLVQGSMLMAQYATRFTKLSRFTPNLIPDEEKKAQKLERDLNLFTHNQIACLEVKRFVDLLNKTSLVEEWVRRSTTAKAEQRDKHFLPDSLASGGKRSFKRVAYPTTLRAMCPK